MKSFRYLLVLYSLVGLLLISCSDKNSSPVEPTNLNSTINLDKGGPVIHRVTGAGLLFGDGKNLGARYAAKEYSDGTFDGEYEINCANATGDPTFKWNGNVLSFLVYENAGEYGGKMAVFFGQEKTHAYAGWYDVFYAIDNDQPGQTTGPDQVNYFIVCAPTLEYIFGNGMTIGDFYALSPADLINILGTLDCTQGNITVE